MSKGHTPGPWKVRKIGNLPALKICADTPCFVPHIARTEWGPPALWAVPDFEEASANARLIAAAPDLLAALRELATLPNKHRPDRVWDDARAAIAKAEGKD